MGTVAVPRPHRDGRDSNRAKPGFVRDVSLILGDVGLPPDPQVQRPPPPLESHTEPTKLGPDGNREAAHLLRSPPVTALCFPDTGPGGSTKLLRSGVRPEGVGISRAMMLLKPTTNLLDLSTKDL
eukprot:5728681-Alexandrium_andersonii.AAC.1